jgi:hypothetical protein
MREEFEGMSAGLNAPASDGQEIDLSVEDAAFDCTRALYIGTAGDVKAQMRGGAVVTFKNAIAGVAHPWRLKKVFKEGTSAADLVALW